MKQSVECNGILVVDKPGGITSHDVVDRVRRLFKTKRVGHTGTLDPDATGVLVLCLGIATRLAEYLSSSRKHYQAEFIFGVCTDTMDASGAVLSEQDASGLTEQTLLDLLPLFRGKILQTPPMVSARHHEGRRLYELAREGVTVEREAREVTISELELTAFRPGPRAHAELEITCSTGTYIRVLADDLGVSTGIGAHMKTLRRTWVGTDVETAFTLGEAHSLESLETARDEGTLHATLVPLSDALRAMPRYTLREEGLLRLLHGQPVSIEEIARECGRVRVRSGCCLPPPSDLHFGIVPDTDGTKTFGASPPPLAELAAILDEQGEVCAVVRRGSDTLTPVKVLKHQ